MQEDHPTDTSRFHYRIVQMAPLEYRNATHYFEVQFYVHTDPVTRLFGNRGRWQTLRVGKTQTIDEAHKVLDDELERDDQDAMLRAFRPKLVYRHR